MNPSLLSHAPAPLARQHLPGVLRARRLVNACCLAWCRPRARGRAWQVLRPLGSVALMGLACAPAVADELDTLQFQAGQSVMYDSNVYRLSDSADTQATLGTPGRSDTIAVTTLGVKLNKPYSLQRFELGVSADHHRYSNFDNLNFTAFNYAAAWRWSLTPALHGNLTADRREFADNTADVQNTGAGNVRTNRSTAFDAEYELGSAWRLVGGVFERSSKSSETLTYDGDSTVLGQEAGVRYVFASGSALAYRYKQGQGEYASQSISGMGASDFDDKEHEFRADWSPTGRMMVRTRLAHLDRTHDAMPSRDFSGVVGQLEGIWTITGKTRLAYGVVRELGSYQTASSSYYTGHRFFIAPTWKPTEKTAVKARYQRGQRDYSGALPGVAESNREDTISFASLILEWEPVRALTLAATLQRDKRTSSAPGFDYSSHQIGISALASF